MSRRLADFSPEKQEEIRERRRERRAKRRARQAGEAPPEPTGQACPSTTTPKLASSSRRGRKPARAGAGTHASTDHGNGGFIDDAEMLALASVPDYEPEEPSIYAGGMSYGTAY